MIPWSYLQLSLDPVPHQCRSGIGPRAHGPTVMHRMSPDAWLGHPPADDHSGKAWFFLWATINWSHCSVLLLEPPGTNSLCVCVAWPPLFVFILWADWCWSCLCNIYAFISLETGIFPYIWEHVGVPVLLAVCIGFNEQESSSYYTVYPIFPSGREGCLM